MKNENTQHTPKITKSTVDFIINADTKVRFVPFEKGDSFEYRACVYYKGCYDGMVKNIRYTTATQKDAEEIFKAYTEQEEKNMRIPFTVKDGIERLSGNYDEALFLGLKASEKIDELLKENEQLKKELNEERVHVSSFQELYLTEARKYGQLGTHFNKLEALNAELLEALKETSRYFVKRSGKGKMAKRVEALVKSAIAKAEGKTLGVS